jgi:hypothetical protein
MKQKNVEELNFTKTRFKIVLKVFLLIVTVILIIGCITI